MRLALYSRGPLCRRLRRGALDSSGRQPRTPPAVGRPCPPARGPTSRKPSLASSATPASRAGAGVRGTPSARRSSPAVVVALARLRRHRVRHRAAGAGRRRCCRSALVAEDVAADGRRRRSSRRWPSSTLDAAARSDITRGTDTPTALLARLGVADAEAAELPAPRRRRRAAASAAAAARWCRRATDGRRTRSSWSRATRPTSAEQARRTSRA
ncbi:MAG: hypothetical protein MZW92_65025 [Comamonadaceae bacterium]|nr:hypothetical protein [Comamonadaceae bacterium]